MDNCLYSSEGVIILNNYVRPDFDLKTLNPYDVYQAIEQCNNKILKITYCSLRVDGQCMDTKTNIIKIKRLYKTCDFIEGTILRDNKLVEDIVLKVDQILKIECIKSGKPNNKPEEKPTIFDIIKSCNGMVKLTQCTKIEKGKCTNKTSFPFLVTEIDRRNNNIKGYRIRDGRPPEYIVLDASLILNIECLTQSNSPNFPWGLIPFLIMQIKNN